jgi:hypothetical protein
LFLVMLAVTVHASAPLSNRDTWFHLRIGHQLWGTWSLSHPGALSSFATSPWVPTQWSTEMLSARVEDWFGLPGVAWLFGVFYLLLVAGAYLCCRSAASPAPAVAAAVLVVVASAPVLSARPQIVSLVLLLVVVASWVRSGRTLRAPWHLVPLTWLWATAHGLWSIGVVVGLTAALGIVLDRRPDRRTSLSLVAVPALSVVAACLTPVGPRLVTSQLAVGARSSMIDEWGATSFREPAALAVAVMVAAVLVGWARSRASRPVSWLQVLLVLLAGGMTVLVTRLVPCGAVVVAPLFAAAVQQVVASRSPWQRPRARELAAVAVAVVALLGVLAVQVGGTADGPAGVPSAFGSRLAALPAGSPIAVEDGIGSWVEYRYPSLNPVIDGMLDAYPVGYIERFGDFRELRPGWTTFLRQTGAEVAISKGSSPLTAALQDQLGWRVVDRDAGYVYLVAPAS